MSNIRVTGNWVYKDHEGNDWIRIKRQEDETGKKSFLPENLKTGEFKMLETERPLFNLQGIAKSDLVIFVEGEKCAYELIKKGVCATTAMGGANAPTNKTDFSPLKGKVVIIWPDNDQPGFKYAQNIQKACLDAGALNVKILKPPSDKPQKWDAFDAIAEGFDCIDFIKNGERYNSENSSPADDGILSFCLDEIETKPVKWLWDDYIALGKLTAIAGHPGLGKSQITISISAIVSNGGLFPDRTQCQNPGTVLFLSAEDDAADTIKPRLIAADADLKKCHVLHAVHTADGKNKSKLRSFDLKRDVERLDQKVQEIGDVRLVIIDPISAYLGETDSHNNADIRGLLAPLQQWRQKMNSLFS